MPKISTFFCVLAVLLFSVAPSAAQQQAKLRPFRSELWQLEYREDEDQRELLSAEDLQGGTGGGGQRGGLRLVELNSQIGDPGLGIESVSVPGDTTIDQVTSEVPIAEMQFQAASSMSSSGSFDDSSSDWDMRGLGVGRRQHALTGSSNGPSITTVLVGLVACIVMIGAFLTGRE